MKSSLSLVLAALLTGALLALGAPPAGASAPPSADDAPGYAVKRFHLRDDDAPRLVKAWQAWRARDHQRYTTVVQRSCYCLEQRAIETVVAGGRSPR